MKNIILFVGVILGTMFLVTWVLAIGHGDRTGWMYLLLAVFCFVVAAGLGQRLAEFVRRPPDA